MGYISTFSGCLHAFSEPEFDAMSPSYWGSIAFLVFLELVLGFLTMRVWGWVCRKWQASDKPYHHTDPYRVALLGGGVAALIFGVLALVACVHFHNAVDQIFAALRYEQNGGADNNDNNNDNGNKEDNNDQQEDVDFMTRAVNGYDKYAVLFHLLVGLPVGLIVAQGIGSCIGAFVTNRKLLQFINTVCGVALVMIVVMHSLELGALTALSDFCVDLRNDNDGGGNNKDDDNGNDGGNNNDNNGQDGAEAIMDFYLCSGLVPPLALLWIYELVCSPVVAVLGLVSSVLLSSINPEDEDAKPFAVSHTESVPPRSRLPYQS